MEVNNMILGLRVMCKHNTLYEVQGNRGLSQMQINEAKSIFNANNGAKIYALTKFNNSAYSRMDYLWIEVKITDLL